MGHKTKNTGSLEVIVYSARNLSDTRTKGLPCYCKLKLGRQLFGTDPAASHQITNPKWDTKASFKKVAIPSKEVLVLTCLNSKNRFVGRVKIDLDTDVLMHDGWYPLMDKKNRKSVDITGELHIRAEFIPQKIGEVEAQPKPDKKKLKEDTEAQRRELLGAGELPQQKDKEEQHGNPFNLQEEDLSRNLDTVEAVEREIQRVRGMSKASTQKSLQLLEKSAEVGANTMNKLQQQGEQLKAISHDMSIIEGNVAEGERNFKMIQSMWGRFKSKSSKSVRDQRHQLQRAPGNPQERREKGNSQFQEVKERNLVNKFTRANTEPNLAVPEYARDEVNDDLDRIGVLTLGLKEMAIEFSKELSSQSATIDKLHEQADTNYFNIRKQQAAIIKEFS